MSIEELLRLSGITNKTKFCNAGSNISVTGNEKAELMKKHNIRPGTDEWFRLWFAMPHLTGEKPIADK